MTTSTNASPMTVQTAIRQLQAASFEVRMRNKFWCVFRSLEDSKNDIAIARHENFIAAVTLAMTPSFVTKSALSFANAESALGLNR